MAAVSRITATPVTEMGPLFWLWPASRPHAASKKGSHQHGPRPKPRSATGPSRLESPAKRPRIGVWTMFNMDKGPLPPSSISRNPVSYSAARTFHFLKTSTPHFSSSACFPHQPPSSQSGDLVGRGWGLAFRHQQSGPEVNRPSAAENPLLGPQSTSHLRLSPVPTVAAGDGMQVAERLDLSFLSFLLFLAVLDVYDRFTV
jgi:hypothetical protein